MKHKHKFIKVVKVCYDAFGTIYKRKKCKCGAMKDTAGYLMRCVGEIK